MDFKVRPVITLVEPGEEDSPSFRAAARHCARADQPYHAGAQAAGKYVNHQSSGSHLFDSPGEAPHHSLGVRRSY
jgi:hypothetical protein